VLAARPAPKRIAISEKPRAASAAAAGRSRARFGALATYDGDYGEIAARAARIDSIARLINCAIIN